MNTMIVRNLSILPPWVNLTKVEHQDSSHGSCNIVPSCKDNISPSIEMAF
jgi:hypothetical protein